MEAIAKLVRFKKFQYWATCFTDCTTLLTLFPAWCHIQFEILTCKTTGRLQPALSALFAAEDETEGFALALAAAQLGGNLTRTMQNELLTP